MTDYPKPTSPAATAVMKGNRRRDTGPELRVRRALHARGLRYRVDRSLDVPGRRVRPDIVFGPTKIAVFVDGCFWHACPEHGNSPSKNATYWREKLARNTRRDAEVSERLRSAGWQVIRIWEHQDPIESADQIAEAVAARRKMLSARPRHSARQH